MAGTHSPDRNATARAERIQAWYFGRLTDTPEVVADIAAALSVVNVEALEREVPVHDGLVTLHDLWAAFDRWPGLAEVIRPCFMGVTFTDLGLPERDWRYILHAFRHWRERLRPELPT
jgi:hypothetical protein